MDYLLADLERRHKRKVSLPFTIGDDVLVVDLLAPRSTDVYPTTRLIDIDPAGRGIVRVSTCYPDHKGEYQRPAGDPKTWYLNQILENLGHIKAEYEVSQALVKALKRDEVLVTDKRYKIAPNEYVLNFEWYQRLCKFHGDIEYRAMLN